MNYITLLILAAEVVLMLLQLRDLMRTSNTPFYHPFTQAVVKLTNPLVNFLPFSGAHIKSFYCAGFILSVLVSLVFWGVLSLLILKGNAAVILLFGLLMPVKAFGYLFIGLLLAQALTSWLPSTRNISIYLGTITAPLAAPVQRIIPPIGVIDISLMVIMIVLFALNSLMAKLFGAFWLLL